MNTDLRWLSWTLFVGLTVAWLAQPAFGQVTVPYDEDFEAGPGGWTVTGGVWEHGVPNNGVLNSAYSGTNVWQTGLTVNYPNNADAYLISPVFDLSGITYDVEFSMQTSFTIESFWDSVSFEYSFDGTAWTKIGNVDPNWYNYAAARIVGDAFSGDMIAWQRRYIIIPGSAGQANFQVRLRLLTDGSVVRPGFAMDDAYLGPPLERTFSLVAGGVAVPDGGTVEIPSTSAGTVGLYALEVHNASAGDGLNVTQVELLSSNNLTNIQINGNPSPAAGPSGIDAGQSDFIDIEYEPQSAGLYSATFRITHNGVNASPVTVTLSGAAGPEIRVEDSGGAALDNNATYMMTGTMVYSFETPLSFSIVNSGSDPLALTGAPLVAIGNMVNCSVTVEPPMHTVPVNDAIELGLRVTPGAKGPFSFDVTIETDAVRNPTFRFTVEGVADDLGVIEVADASIDFGSPQVDSTNTRTLIVRNIGPGPLLVTRLRLFDTNGYWHLEAAWPPVPLFGAGIEIGPAGSGQDELELTFGYTPDSVVGAPYEAELEIESNSLGLAGTLRFVTFTGGAERRTIDGDSGRCAATPAGHPAALATTLLAALLLLAGIRRLAPRAA